MMSSTTLCEHCEQPAVQVDMKYGQLVCPHCLEHWTISMDAYALLVSFAGLHRKAWQCGAESAQDLFMQQEEAGLHLSEAEIDRWGERVDAYLLTVGKEDC
jgi:hypothetical protein